MKKKQHSMHQNFDLLRKKYDLQKSLMCSLIWSEYAPFLPQLHHIPPVESESYPESESRIGHYNILGDIGRGQTANVKSCQRVDDTKSEYAVKVMSKNKVTSIASLRRVSDEIKALQILAGQHITNITEVIHTATKLYIVLEKGGKDLFSFFDEYPIGVPENIAKKVSYQLLSALNFCHERFYCHRDIKPEVEIMP
jgi:serine/threonine protein kinase